MSRRAATVSMTLPWLALATTLALVAGPAQGARDNWLQLGESRQARVFIDTAGIERTPRHVKFWTLLSYSRPQPGGVLAEKRLFLYACKDKSLQWQQSITYPDPLAEEPLLRVVTRQREGDAPALRKVLERWSTEQADRRQAPLPEQEFAAVFARLCQ